MDTTKLVATGLTQQQASAYVLLLEKGTTTPPDAAGSLKISRTNAYKILDKLVEIGLAVKSEKQKKIMYKPLNPTALSRITDQYRAEASAREEAANSIIHELLERYNQHNDKPTVVVFSGKQRVVSAYRRQINLKEDIHFIRADSDIASMGFETMHDIRVAPGRNNNKRYGILGMSKGPVNLENHKRGGLIPTFMDQKDYTAPVEWSVTASSLLIVTYAKEPQAILIIDPFIAGAFMQLWSILNAFIQSQPMHQKYGAKD